MSENKQMRVNRIQSVLLLCLALVFLPAQYAAAQIAAAHVYHNHMPNFWPYYDTSSYNSASVGSPIRYTYDGKVIQLKNNPPAGYSYYLPPALGGGIMPHDDLVTYYSHNAKTGAYLYWPWQVAGDMNANANTGQVHVTMSGAVVNNVNEIIQTGTVPGYSDPNWGQSWTNAFNNLKTPGGNRTLDLIHFTGHHSMGPLVGSEYFLKDLIYQNATLAQSYFLGGSFKSSKGFFPTELGFSERLIPVLAKLGIQWSVLGNNHYSRTLRDYPYDTYYPNKDTLISPPNRADLQNVSNVGGWVTQQMAHEQQQIANKYPFASTPHWVRYVDPATGAESRVVGVPVDQSGSWLEGWEGAATASDLMPYQGLLPQKQFFVIAHDGDNSSGRAGSSDTWYNGRSVTCSGGVQCMGISEYMINNMPPASDVAHVQDGSWIDTRDSSSDPTWYHWRLPFGIWKGQFSEFNRVTGMNLAPKTNLSGQQEGMTVSLEYGWHYLERNFALLQAAMNYAKTAEQIWLEKNPNYWSPSTALDNQITYPGNQLNPWMISFPVKGNPANNYAGGANPAELGWYFLLPAMDSGFGYYDENKDDSVKPTLAFNNSLYFTKPYVQANIGTDHTGPSVWWPQRWPYNPGSVNSGKAEGWTVHHFDHNFAIYTYAYDVSGISNIKLRIRTHTAKLADATDNTFRVYDPVALAAAGVPNITPSKVSAWQDYNLTKRELLPVMNGVNWVQPTKDTLQILPAQEIGDLYYAYIGNYRDQLLDYYIEATDSKGNVTRSEIQTVYVGAGRYNLVGGKYVEDYNGAIKGTYPFLVVDNQAPTAPANLASGSQTDRSINLNWTPSTDNVGVTGYKIFRDGVQVGTSATANFTDSGLNPSTSYSYTVKAHDAAGNTSAASAAKSVTTKAPDTTAPSVPTGLTAGTVSAGSVTFCWTASTDNYDVTGYDIYRNGTKIGTSATTCFTDNSVTPSTTYSYKVAARDAAGNVSAQSAALSITTQAGNVATVYYYRTDWPTVNIHYSPTGGTWTAVPGVAMDAACTGYKVKVINIGSATGLTVVFNNNSGSWDNNGGKNYTVGTGISLVRDGAVTSGSNPCSVVVDTEPPTVPANLIAGTIKYNSVAMSWTASTDNKGVTGYQILRNGAVLATATATSYTDTTVSANTAYTYNVKAYDAAGNYSAASNTMMATTPKVPDTTAPTVPTNLAASNISATSVTLSWTASTDDSGTVAGYKVFRGTAQVGTATTNSYTDSGLTANTTYSYTVKAYDAAGNTSAASAAKSVKTSTAVQNKITVYYKKGFATTCFHYAPAGGSWTTAPGPQMAASEVSGYNEITVDIGSATSIQVAFNNCSGQWDSNNGSNYTFNVGTWNYDAARSPKIASGIPSTPTNVSVTFKENATTSWGQNVYVVGDIPQLGSWSAANAIALSSATYPVWAGTVQLPANTAVQYKYIKKDSNGNVIWEGGSNHTFTTPSTGSTTRNDAWQN